MFTYSIRQDHDLYLWLASLEKSLLNNAKWYKGAYGNEALAREAQSDKNEIYWREFVAPITRAIPSEDKTAGADLAVHVKVATNPGIRSEAVRQYGNPRKWENGQKAMGLLVTTGDWICLAYRFGGKIHTDTFRVSKVTSVGDVEYKAFLVSDKGLEIVTPDRRYVILIGAGIEGAAARVDVLIKARLGGGFMPLYRGVEALAWEPPTRYRDAQSPSLQGQPYIDKESPSELTFWND